MIIESLNLEKKPFALISLIMIIDYLKNYSNKLISGLNLPEFINNNTLFLGNNATYQLSILEIDTYNYSIGSKIKSLYDTVNNTSTNIGSRYLKYRLLNPFTNPDIINRYLNLTDNIIQKNIYQQISSILSELSDIEKLKRKMCFSILQPYEFYEIIDTLNNILKLNKIIKDNKLDDLKLKKETKDELSKFGGFVYRDVSRRIQEIVDDGKK
jgi:DNA mismatch repair protein MutS